MSFLRVNLFEKTKFFVIRIISQYVPKCFYIHMKIIPRRDWYSALGCPNFFLCSLTTSAKKFPEPTKEIQRYRPINDILRTILSLQWGSSWGNFQKSISGHNFWLEWPTDLRSTPLSYIFNALFRDTPLGHVHRAQPNSQISQIFVLRMLFMCLYAEIVLWALETIPHQWLSCTKIFSFFHFGTPYWL